MWRSVLQNRRFRLFSSYTHSDHDSIRVRSQRCCPEDSVVLLGTLTSWCFNGCRAAAGRRIRFSSAKSVAGLRQTRLAWLWVLAFIYLYQCPPSVRIRSSNPRFLFIPSSLTLSGRTTKWDFWDCFTRHLRITGHAVHCSEQIWPKILTGICECSPWLRILGLRSRSADFQRQ